MSSKDYYQILGISKDASVDEIKKAFRRQAVKHHPDQGGDEAKFKEINQAYEVLSNPEKRQRYDQFGQAGLGGGAGFGQSQARDFSFDFGDSGLGDILGSFFGGANQQTARSGRDIEIVLNIDFKEAIFGITKSISLRLDDVCSQCQGQQAQPGTKVKTCANCQGSGQYERMMRTPLGNLRHQVRCPACSGEGREITTPCSACHGKGVKQASKEIDLTIPAGIEDGSTIRLRQQGEKNKAGVAGDLYIIVQVAPDKHFTREGNLILSEESINIVQAALGDKIKVKTIDGSLTIKIPAGTQSGTDFRLDKKGVPYLRSSGRGDHIVRIKVVIPKRLNARQKQLLKDFAKL